MILLKVHQKSNIKNTFQEVHDLSPHLFSPLIANVYFFSELFDSELEKPFNHMIFLGFSKTQQ